MDGCAQIKLTDWERKFLLELIENHDYPLLNKDEFDNYIKNMDYLERKIRGRVMSL